jgi:hypothetical protein
MNSNIKTGARAGGVISINLYQEPMKRQYHGK